MNTALVIGAGSALARAIIHRLMEDDEVDRVLAVSRVLTGSYADKVIPQALNTLDEHAIEGYCQRLIQAGMSPARVFFCTGVLHQRGGQTDVFPEKALEQVNERQLLHYYRINALLPMLWFKALAPLFTKGQSSTWVVFSARIGSIADNRLGGWYGYRASKAALNMLVKTTQVELARRARQVRLIAYHPGTVQSPLSAPFSAKLNPTELLTPGQSVSRLWQVLDKVGQQESPWFVDHRGQTIPW